MLRKRLTGQYNQAPPKPTFKTSCIAFSRPFSTLQRPCWFPQCIKNTDTHIYFPYSCPFVYECLNYFFHYRTLNLMFYGHQCHPWPLHMHTVRSVLLNLLQRDETVIAYLFSVWSMASNFTVIVTSSKCTAVFTVQDSDCLKCFSSISSPILFWPREIDFITFFLINLRKSPAASFSYNRGDSSTASLRTDKNTCFFIYCSD